MSVRPTVRRALDAADPLTAAGCRAPSFARRVHPTWPLALLLVAAGVVAALPHPAAAAGDGIVHDREGHRVDPAEVAQLLGGTAPRTRSIRLLDDAPPTAPRAEAAVGSGTAPMPVAAPASPVAYAPAPPAAPSASPADGEPAPEGLSLPVRFAFGSAEILPDARAQLDALADGIRMLAPQRVVSVEGHTDAAGPDAFNLKLSRERALAVRSYLMRRGIDGQRLKAVGYGESWPVAGADPYAGQNRRVQFRGS